MKIVTIVGARPQFIKAAAIRRAIEAHNREHPYSRVREVLVHTGQHYDHFMDRIFFDELRLPKPDYHLGVGSGPHGKQTAAMLDRIEALLVKEDPRVVMVYGDTNSTLAGALAAAKLGIPIAHVEAGLRSYNRRMPEEINRLVTDHVSTLLFCPTRHAVDNLAGEGIKGGRTRLVRKTGDVMYDSVLYYAKLAKKNSTILKDLDLLRFDTRPSSLVPHSYYLATLHRAENTDNPQRLKSILEALDKVGKDTPVIFPLHPRTKKMMKVHHLLTVGKSIRLIQPVSYLRMLALEKNAKIIFTDSGGVQKEAYWFKVPCLTLREETEWVETLRSGRNVLVGVEAERILEEVGRVRKKKWTTGETGIFGSGRASEKIVQMIVERC